MWKTSSERNPHTGQRRRLCDGGGEASRSEAGRRGWDTLPSAGCTALRGERANPTSGTPTVMTAPEKQAPETPRLGNHWAHVQETHGTSHRRRPLGGRAPAHRPRGAARRRRGGRSVCGRGSCRPGDGLRGRPLLRRSLGSAGGSSGTEAGRCRPCAVFTLPRADRPQLPAEELHGAGALVWGGCLRNPSITRPWGPAGLGLVAPQDCGHLHALKAAAEGPASNQSELRC